MKIKYIILGAILTLFASCEVGGYFDLDRSQWFIYNVNDTLVFKADTSSYDTFIIGSIINGHQTIDEYHFEFIWVEYIGTTQCENCPLDNFGRTNQPVEIIDLNGQFPHVGFYYDNPTKSYYFTGDTIIKNIYFERDIPIEDSINDKVKAIYYSNIFGIIRYDMHDGRVYKLQIE